MFIVVYVSLHGLNDITQPVCNTPQENGVTSGDKSQFDSHATGSQLTRVDYSIIG